ncbi:MAG: hypothetical protein GX621_06335 [Pirellulaceae bacterium]|nr:hypothetical protein [Pirellulaceae bacterium]
MIDVFDKTVEVAKNAGSPFPEAVAQYLADSVSVVESMAGPQIFVWNGTEREPLSVAMARLKESEDIGPLFTDGKVNVRTMSYDAFRAVRRHNPELVGLRKKRKFA